MPLTEHLFRIHGETLRLTTNSPVVVQAVADLLADFESPACAGPGSAALELSLRGVAGAAQIPLFASADSEMVSTGDRSATWYTLYRDGGRHIFDFPGSGRFGLDAGTGRLDGWLVDPASRTPEQWSDLVRLAILELLRVRGLDAIHASAVEKDGRGFLFVGRCGRGKTTACLSLARAGYRCVSDDHPLLRRTATGMEVLPFLTEFRVSEKTVGFFPELDTSRSLLRLGVVKQSFRLEEAFGADCKGDQLLGCRPDFLIFPRLVDWPESRLEPLPRARAFEELLPESLLVLESERATRLFRTLSQMVQTTSCYRLHFGQDVLNLPVVFDRLGESVSACA
jgi:hypothetical protein